MAHADALSLQADRSSGFARWALAGAVVIALHGLALLYLQQPPEPVAFDSQVPIELDMLPPPMGEAQLDEAGETATAVPADAVPQETVEDTPAEPPPPDASVPPETPPEDAPPPDTPDTTAVEEPPVTATETPPDVATPPPDVEAVVPLPPENEVVAIEETVEPPKRTPPPVAKREPPKRPAPRREPTRVEPKRETAERPAAPPPAANAGGRAGASVSAGAARSAALAYGQRVRAVVSAQQRRGLNLDGEARVTFTVGRGGNVVSVSSSGPPEAAREVQAMVRRASLPSMPAEMTQSTASYTVRINFNR